MDAPSKHICDIQKPTNLSLAPYTIRYRPVQIGGGRSAPRVEEVIQKNNKL